VDSHQARRPLVWRRDARGDVDDDGAGGVFADDPCGLRGVSRSVADSRSRDGVAPAMGRRSVMI